MPATELLAVGTTTAVSAPFAVADGASATLLRAAPDANTGGVAVEMQGSSGEWYPIDSLSPGKRVVQVSGPGVYRVSRKESTSACGVDRTNADLWVAPVNTVPPAVTGDTDIGDTLTTTNGTWTSTGTTTYTYQWQRDEEDLEGETESTYVVVEDDQGTVIVCVVTATNPGGAVSEPSNETTIPSQV